MSPQDDRPSLSDQNRPDDDRPVHAGASALRWLLLLALGSWAIPIGLALLLRGG